MSQGLTSTTGGDAASVFEGMELRTQFSPLFQLSDGAVVGASLELCGPQGTNFDTPRALRRTATLMEQRAVLDSRKFEFADTAAARHVADAIPLFVAVDIDVYDSARTVPYGEILTLMIEPRSILRRPQSRIAQVAQARRNGTPIALEGVTADRRTATLLTLIEPDIVLLHPDTLKSVPSSEIAHLAHILAAHTERTAAIVVAAGVDTEDDRRTALTLGARHGLGALHPPVADADDRLLGTIAALPTLPARTTPESDEKTPFAIASKSGIPRPADKRLLLEMSKDLERTATESGVAVVLGTFQDQRNFSTPTSQRWRALSEKVGLVGVYGAGIRPMSDGNIHYAPLSADDALVDEWNVAVLGMHFAALISARQIRDARTNGHTEYMFVQSYDRTIVTQAVRSILSRFA
ncbi:hypothetical protein LK459_07770 [Gordonia otitidis]|nr:DICT sensory domain-containing protein [Gordonia otitidis]UEA60715.1 hypothetical protein LK459_07770 [Gordonia otitidis]